MTDARWVTGDMLGLELPADAITLGEGGPAFLTRAFRAFGAMGADNAVTAITELAPFNVGGTGAKALLAVAYDDPAAGLPTQLFVKFSRNFEDAILDRVRHMMEPEIKLAALSRAPGFPIAIPQPLFADFAQESGTGILITARIPYGQGAIEPHWPKCLDYKLPDPVDHYRALFETIASLAGSHKGGRLPAFVGEQFPFDPQATMARDRLAEDPAKLRYKIDRLSQFQQRWPGLLPDEIAGPDVLARFETGAQAFLTHQQAIKTFLQADPDFIALCHWNANIDNAWFWRADGRLHCGLMDWGAVGQMNLAMTIWGCLSGAEIAIWDEHLDVLLDDFTASFVRYGGAALDREELMTHLLLYVAMMGLNYLMDAPPRIIAAVPELDQVETRFDPRFEAAETARTQLVILTNVLFLWRKYDVGGLIARRFG